MNQTASTKVVMVSPESRLFCRVESSTHLAREQQRFKALVELGLLKAETVPVFEEATQTAARFLETPICILGLMTQDRQWIKSAVGLSKVGLMNELAVSRQVRRSESYCTYVVDTHQVLAIEDTATNPTFAKSIMFQHYGIRAYLGAPLVTTSGHCLGTLAVMDLVPRTFTAKDIEFLTMMARWALSEIERNCLLKAQNNSTVGLRNGRPSGLGKSNILENNEHLSQPEISHLKIKLLTRLSEDLRTPLTSVMGMTSVIRREIYGPLSSKQKEYLEIIQNSGQHLIELVDEISALGVLTVNDQKLQVSSVDIEMLCQQAMQKLEALAKRRKLHIKVSVEPGNRIWQIDKEKVRQILYYLIFSVMQSSEAGCVVRVHAYRKHEKMQIAIWVSHLWLEIDFEMANIVSLQGVGAISNGSEVVANECGTNQKPATSYLHTLQLESISSLSVVLAAVEQLAQTSDSSNDMRENLGLLLSCQLAELHGGEITVQGWSEWGDRYVVSLPQMVTENGIVIGQ